MNVAGVLVRRCLSGTSLSSVWVDLFALFPNLKLVCWDKITIENCIEGQCAVCELNSSSCHPKVVSALLCVLVSLSGSLQLPWALRALDGQFLYVCPRMSDFLSINEWAS